MSRRQQDARSAGWRERLNRDDGTTLVELMVGIALMTVFMAMFTGAILMMSTAMNSSQAVTSSSSQLSVAFQNLDKVVRYAAAVSTPGVGATGDWYVELRSTYTGAQVCTQLRVDTAARQLQRRTWNVVDDLATAPTGWTPIASGISNGDALPGAISQPFHLGAPAPTAQSQQLTVNLVAESGSGRSRVDSASSFTLTAMNSAPVAPLSPVCLEMGRP